MRTFRKQNKLAALTSGPGKLTQALNLTREHNCIDLVNSDNLFLTEGPSVIRSSDIIATERVGIRVGCEKRWRFSLINNDWVSK